MTAVGTELRSTFWATVDLLLAAGGLAIVFYPPVVIGNALLDSPLEDPLVNLVVGVLAAGGAYPFVTGDWSLGRLGDYILALTASVLVLGLVAVGVVVALDVELSGDNPLHQALLLALAHLLAYLLVYRDGYAIVKDALAGR